MHKIVIKLFLICILPSAFSLANENRPLEILPSAAEFLKESNIEIIDILTDKIKTALVENELYYDFDNPEDLELKFDKRSDPISHSFIDIKSVSLISLDKARKVFNVKINFLDKENKTHDCLISGSYVLYVHIPMLKHTLAKGETIEEQDIEEVKIEADKVKKSIIKNEFDLVGKTPKSIIRAYKMIHFKEISEPIIVNKGDQVNVHYINDNLSIKTIAIALESGFKGSVIKVKNPRTSVILSGVVESSNSVKVVY